VLPAFWGCAANSDNLLASQERFSSAERKFSGELLSSEHSITNRPVSVKLTKRYVVLYN